MNWTLKNGNTSLEITLIRSAYAIYQGYLKDGAVVLTLPVSKLCNLSMKCSKFPLDCKTILKTLYKKGSKSDPKNYCLVSLLPLVSKVIEKVINNKTEISLSKNKIWYRYQSGFRKLFVTNSCLTLLANSVNTKRRANITSCRIIIDPLEQGAHWFASVFY